MAPTTKPESTEYRADLASTAAGTSTKTLDRDHDSTTVNRVAVKIEQGLDHNLSTVRTTSTANCGPFSTTTDVTIKKEQDSDHSPAATASTTFGDRGPPSKLECSDNDPTVKREQNLVDPTNAATAATASQDVPPIPEVTSADIPIKVEQVSQPSTWIDENTEVTSDSGNITVEQADSHDPQPNQTLSADEDDSSHSQESNDEDGQSVDTTKATPTILTAAAIGLEEHDVPKNMDQLATHVFDPNTKLSPVKLIAKYAVHLMNPRNQLNMGQKQIVYDIVKMLWQFEGEIDAAQMENCKWILATIMGESAQARRPYEFPPPFPTDASTVMERLTDRMGAVDDKEEPETSSVPPAATNAKRKRKRDQPTPPRSEGVLQITDPQVKAVMHNITVSVAQRRSYKVTDLSLAKNHKNFGHNGLEVGDWWPLRCCAIRDGAHGSNMGGIAGDNQDGARSIVVSGELGYVHYVATRLIESLGGEFEGLDEDLGDQIYYAGSNSTVNTDPNTPHLSHATKQMQRSLEHHRSIRVLRSSKGKSKYAPAAGIRYDGLYKITSQEKGQNGKGGAYVRFVLQRMPDQPDIDLSRPTRREREIATKLKETVY